MKSAQAIFGAIVAALGLAAFVTVYDELKPGTQTPPPPNKGAQKANSLTPANSIARDFAVLPKSLHSTPATPAQQAIAAAPTPALLAARVAAHQADPATLPSHAESVDVCARSTEGDHHGDIGRANAGAARAPAPRTPQVGIEVSEDDLRQIAQAGYEGAASSEHDQQAQAVGLFLNEALLEI
jgi:hypothetical protein